LLNATARRTERWPRYVVRVSGSSSGCCLPKLLVTLEPWEWVCLIDCCLFLLLDLFFFQPPHSHCNAFVASSLLFECISQRGPSIHVYIVFVHVVRLLLLCFGAVVVGVEVLFFILRAPLGHAAVVLDQLLPRIRQRHSHLVDRLDGGGSRVEGGLDASIPSDFGCLPLEPCFEVHLFSFFI